MRDYRVSDSDMPIFLWQTRPEVRALDALLSGNCDPQDAPAELRLVAEVLAVLQAPPDQREVAGWGEALIAYRETVGVPGMSSRSRSRRPRLITSLLSARLAPVAGLAAVAVFGGGIAAAYTGSLPVALQKIAHDTIAAPGVREIRTASATKSSGHPVGPSVSGSAEYGLCNAYQHASEHGNASLRAVAFRNLVNAAGGAGNVAAFCAAVQHPGAANPPGGQAGHSGSAADASHGQKPTSAPGKGNGHGTGNGNPHGRQS